MNIFVDGFQNTGKTTLIEKSDFKFNRFPFNQYLDLFELKSQDNLNAYQIAKDLGILFGLQYNKENVIFDRGPFSTIFYSIKENRYGEKTLELMMKFLKEISKFKNCKYVFVVKKNEDKSIKREHNDGFDYLNDDEDQEKYKLLDYIVNAAKSFGIEISIFTTDFAKPLEDNIYYFNRLLGELTNEYNRN